MAAAKPNYWEWAELENLFSDSRINYWAYEILWVDLGCWAKSSDAAS
jgi:hypothetical protein